MHIIAKTLIKDSSLIVNATGICFNLQLTHTIYIFLQILKEDILQKESIKFKWQNHDST